jgi:hypothetical protein
VQNGVHGYPGSPPGHRLSTYKPWLWTTPPASGEAVGVVTVRVKN